MVYVIFIQYLLLHFKSIISHFLIIIELFLVQFFKFVKVSHVYFNNRVAGSCAQDRYAISVAIFVSCTADRTFSDCVSPLSPPSYRSVSF